MKIWIDDIRYFNEWFRDWLKRQDKTNGWKEVF